MDKHSAPIVIGVVINPIAGVGGKAGLKGSDTVTDLHHALSRGGVQNAIKHMQTVIDIVKPHAHTIQFLTVAGDMGESVLDGFSYDCLPIPTKSSQTTAEHTKQACGQFWGKCDIVVFAGGDGTARDIIKTYDFKTPVLGVPAGVKIQSGVFATTPREAGLVLQYFIKGQIKSYTDCDVMDLDEYALQQGILSPQYYGYMKVPNMPHFIQSAKCRPSHDDDMYIQAIAKHMHSILQSDNIYIIGPGKTTLVCLEHLGIQGSLVGVDVIENGKLAIKDASIKDIDDYCKNHTVTSIIVGCVGGQGIIFGRGNQQISPDIIRQVGKHNITVVATPNKLASLQNKPFRVDTGDADLDMQFNGYITVINGFGHKSIYPIKNNI